MALAHDGPVLVDVVTNPDEVSLPGKVKVAQQTLSKVLQADPKASPDNERSYGMAQHLEPAIQKELK